MSAWLEIGASQENPGVQKSTCIFPCCTAMSLRLKHDVAILLQKREDKKPPNDVFSNPYSRTKKDELTPTHTHTPELWDVFILHWQQISVPPWLHKESQGSHQAMAHQSDTSNWISCPALQGRAPSWSFSTLSPLHHENQKPAWEVRFKNAV